MRLAGLRVCKDRFFNVCGWFAYKRIALPAKRIKDRLTCRMITFSVVIRYGCFFLHTGVKELDKHKTAHGR